MNKPLPAHAKWLSDARRRGMTLKDPLVTVALHWRARPVIGYGVVVPDQRSPADLDWSWVRGLEVLIWRRGDAAARVMDAVRAIEAARPRRLLVIDVNDDRVISIVGIDKKGAHVAAA